MDKHPKPILKKKIVKRLEIGKDHIPPIGYVFEWDSWMFLYSNEKEWFEENIPEIVSNEYRLVRDEVKDLQVNGKEVTLEIERLVFEWDNQSFKSAREIMNSKE